MQSIGKAETVQDRLDRIKQIFPKQLKSIRFFVI
nr:MAG TPA: hypothetical protein [Bacteriophage sp.]